MEDYKVIITTSGIGSRLGDLTKFTNKSLVRVGDKPSISYIIELYPKHTEFIITLGHFGSHIKQFLSLCYPDYNFTFVTIDRYEGHGSSLGYSLYQCKKYITSPFIFHASDTILNNYNPLNPKFNYIITSYKNNSSHYRTVNLNGDKVIKINEKGELNFDSLYVGVAGIKDYELFFNEIEKLLSVNYYDISDVHSINNMLSKVKFSNYTINSDDWYDIGNTTELANARKFFTSDVEILDKKDESIFFFDDFVIKFFYDEKVNLNRVLRANLLKGLTPKIISYSENFYKYERANGKLFSKSVNKNKFINFLNWSKNNLWEPKQDNNIGQKCYHFYISKTKQRILQYLEKNNDENSINGENIPNVYDLIDMIDVNWLCDGNPSQFHGDFILDNVIETSDGFCLIDWRQDFSGDLEIGDLYYDLSKLNHNLIVNHDIVNQGLFNYQPENCFILVNSKLIECREILKDFIISNGYDMNKINILTSLIWINMSPLHEYPLNVFLFNYGKYNLYKNIIKNEKYNS